MGPWSMTPFRKAWPWTRLPMSPALHVRDGHDQRVDPAVPDHPFEILESRVLGVAVLTHGYLPSNGGP